MKDKKIFVILVLILCLFAAGILTGYFLFDKSPHSYDEDENVVDYEGNLVRPEEWDSSRISIPNYGILQIEEETNLLRVALMNPKDNPCFFKFTIILDETKTVLYETKLVAPGKAVIEEELNQKISVGEHPITIKIQTFSLENSELEMNGSEIKTKIVSFQKE